MVRGRRTRKVATSSSSATAVVANGHSPLTTQNGTPVKGAAAAMSGKGSAVLMEDFCCNSPKRKEYKIDELLIRNATAHNGFTTNNNTTTTSSTTATELTATAPATTTTTSSTKSRMVLRGTSQNSQSGSGSNGVTNGATGKGSSTSPTNGRLCPVAGNGITRFLLIQSKSKNRKARKKSPNIELVNDDTCDSFTHATSLQEAAANGVVKMEAEDGEAENTHPFQMFGRLPIGNGTVAAAAPEENIFLQEPVLKLTVDEAACVLVQPQTEKEVPDREAAEEEAAKVAVAVALLNQDSNSGDSGVVVDKLQEGATAQSVTPKPLLNVSRPRVPTTPHRILCPSSPQLLNGATGGGGGGGEGGVAENGEGGTEIKREQDEEEGDLQMTKRQLILSPGKDEEELEQETKMPSQLPEELKAPVAVPPKSNGLAGKGHHHQATMEDFFKVRRSVRKTKKEVEREEQLAIEKAILSECDMGLAVKMFENKGRGIVATRPFARGEFVVEYVGEFISIAEANRREQLYARDQSTGCYMYYFKHKNKQYCIDATEETGKLGRLVNHSRNGNLMTRTVEVKGQPHLVLIAKEDIEAGRELNYDYGDRSKESLLHHPWLAY